MVSVKQLATITKKILKSDRDFPFAFSGYPGEGKSTFAGQVAKEIDPKFTFNRNFVFTKEETQEKIESLPRYSTIVIDEAINVLFKRDFMKGKQKEVLRLLDMCRDRNLCMIFNIPDVWDLDKKILNRRLRLWCFVERRGSAYAFKPDNNPFVIDAWHRSSNEKLLKKWREGIHPRISPNYCDQIYFNDFSPKEKAEYLEVKARKKKGAERDEDGNEVVLTEKLLKKIIYEAKYYYLNKWNTDKIIPHGFLTVLSNYDKVKRNTYSMRVREAKNPYRYLKKSILK